MGKVIKAFRKRNGKRHYPGAFFFLGFGNMGEGPVRAACGQKLEALKLTEDYSKLTCKACKRIAKRHFARSGKRGPHRGKEH